MVSGRDFLGPYRLVKIVRAGQHCDVWEATKDPDPKRIAVKVLLKQLIKDRTLVRELRREAEVGVGLKHPSIIDIEEFNFNHELPFLAMELFSSKNLKQDIREQSRRVAFYVTEIITQAAQGLAHLHEKGWVHCDVKPDNFLMSDKGELKLIDFSIAKRNKKGGGLFKGKLKGTRSYMAPEQIRRKSVDGRCDLYSLGCVMYELLAGKPPFTGNSPDELLMKHLRAPPPSLGAANNRVTTEFAELIQKVMSKDREERPPTMYSFLKEFQSLRVYRTGKKPTSPTPEVPTE